MTLAATKITASHRLGAARAEPVPD
jgi:hypothetical protein